MNIDQMLGQFAVSLLGLGGKDQPEAKEDKGKVAKNYHAALVNSISPLGRV